MITAHIRKKNREFIESLKRDEVVDGTGTTGTTGTIDPTGTGTAIIVPKDTGTDAVTDSEGDGGKDSGGDSN